MADDTVDTISPQRVQAIIEDCLPDTSPEEGIPEGSVVVGGIIHDYAFMPGKLAEHRDEVRAMLDLLPAMFHADPRPGGGGGWSFLNACVDRNDVQWTGEHRAMEWLLCLGIGMNMVRWLLPREFWSAFPGGMPYVVVNIDGFPVVSEASGVDV